MSALVGIAAGALALAADFSRGFGSSFHSSTAAFEMQISPRSLIFVRKMTLVSPSFHISVTSVSPGSTVDANRTLMLLMKRGSPSGANDAAIARVANPNEHRPWRIGRWNPNAFAKPGSACSGFQSPLRR